MALSQRQSHFFNSGVISRLAIFAWVLSVAMAGCRKSNLVADNEPLPTVEAVQARHGSLPLVARLSGIVRAENQVVLHPEIAGRIVAVHAENGDSVKKGQPLVEIQAQQYREQVRQAEAGSRIAEARVRQAKARLTELQAQATRTAQLGRRELVTELELETTAARMESAKADVDLAEAELQQAASTLQERRDELGQTVIRAPIRGTVGERNAEVGMQASPSAPLFTMGELERIEVIINLTDVMLHQIHVGDPVRVFSPNGAANLSPLPARLSRISPFLDAISHSAEAQVEVENKEGRLRPGMFVAVDVSYGQSRQATLIPTSALAPDPASGQDGVFVILPPGDDSTTAQESGARSTASGRHSQPIAFRSLRIIARGASAIATDSISPDEWVVTLGHDLIGGGRDRASVRKVDWDHVMELQGLRREDLLESLLRPPALSQNGPNTATP